MSELKGNVTAAVPASHPGRSEPTGRGAAWTEERSDQGPPPRAARPAPPPHTARPAPPPPAA